MTIYTTGERTLDQQPLPTPEILLVNTQVTEALNWLRVLKTIHKIEEDDRSLNLVEQKRVFIIYIETCLNTILSRHITL